MTRRRIRPLRTWSMSARRSWVEPTTWCRRMTRPPRPSSSRATTGARPSRAPRFSPGLRYKAYVYAEFHMHVMPGHEGGGGFIKAIDVTNGKTKWEHDMPDANWSGLVATAGGVVFGGGTDTRELFALDMKPPARSSGRSAPTRARSARRSPTRSTEFSTLLPLLASAVRFRSGPAKSRRSSTRTLLRAAWFGSSPSRVQSSS